MENVAVTGSFLYLHTSVLFYRLNLFVVICKIIYLDYLI